MSDKPVYRQYVVGDQDKTEFGLCYDENNIKLEIKKHERAVRVTIDDRCYNTGNCLVDDEFYKSLLRKEYSRKELTNRIVEAATRLRPNKDCYASSLPQYRLEEDITILHDIIKWAPFEFKCKKFGWGIQLGLK